MVSVNIRLFGGYFKFYLAQARLEDAGLQAAQSLVNDLARIVDGGRLEQQGGDQGFLLRRFQQFVEMVAAGPGVVFKLG